MKYILTPIIIFVLYLICFGPLSKVKPYQCQKTKVIATRIERAQAWGADDAMIITFETGDEREILMPYGFTPNIKVGSMHCIENY